MCQFHLPSYHFITHITKVNRPIFYTLYHLLYVYGLAIGNTILITTKPSKMQLILNCECNSHMHDPYPCTWSIFSLPQIHSYRILVHALPWIFYSSLLICYRSPLTTHISHYDACHVSNIACTLPLAIPFKVLQYLIIALSTRVGCIIVRICT